MANSYLDLGPKGSGDTMTVPPYLEQADISVYVDDVLVSPGLYEWTNASLLTCLPGFPTGINTRVRRITDIDEAKSVQVGASVYDFEAVNQNDKQLLYKLQEQDDIQANLEDAIAAAEAAEAAQLAAEAAEAAAEAAAAFVVSPLLAFDTRALAAAVTLLQDEVRIRRWSTSTPYSPAHYRRVAQPGNVQPTHEGKFQDAAGQWFEMMADAQIDPMALGAVGDGVTNDYTALNNAGAFARAFGIPIRLAAGKTYLFGTTLQLGKIVGIIGKGTLKASGAVNAVIGGSSGTGKTLTSNAARKAGSLGITAHGFTAEQWLWIRSGENAVAAGSAFNPQLGDGGGDNARYCEFVQVEVVTNANAIALNGVVYYGYPLTTSTVYPVDFLQGVVLRDFTFDGSGTGYMLLDWCQNATVERSVRCINPSVAGMIVEHCFGGEISPTVIRSAVSEDSGNPSQYQAIKFRDGCQGVKCSAIVINGEQGLDCTYTPSSNMNGVTRNIMILGGLFKGVNQHPISTHEGTEGIFIADNLIEDCGNGIILRGPNNIVRSNKIFGQTRAAASTTEGIRLGNSMATGNLVQDNTIENFEYGINVLGNSASLLRNDTIDGNKIRDVRYGIAVPQKQSGSVVDFGLRIVNNEIVDTSTSGIELGDNHHGAVIENNVVRQDTNGTHTYSIRVGDASNLSIRNNRAINTGVMVVDLAPNATGIFEKNEAVGTSLRADINPGTTLEFEATIADDAVLVINMGGARWRVEVNGSRSACNGVAWFLATGPTAVAKEGHASFVTSTSVLGGTSGVDGNFTVSYTGGNMYFENRAGGSANVSIRVHIR